MCYLVSARMFQKMLMVQAIGWEASSLLYIWGFWILWASYTIKNIMLGEGNAWMLTPCKNLLDIVLTFFFFLLIAREENKRVCMGKMKFLRQIWDVFFSYSCFCSYCWSRILGILVTLHSATLITVESICVLACLFIRSNLGLPLSPYSWTRHVWCEVFITVHITSDRSVQQAPYEIQQGYMKSPALGKKYPLLMMYHRMASLGSLLSMPWLSQLSLYPACVCALDSPNPGAGPCT